MNKMSMKYISFFFLLVSIFCLFLALKMVRPVKRRHSSVVKAKALVHAIRYIRQQKQIPNLDRIQKYMIRVYDTKPAETEKQLQYTCKDGLIISYTTLGKKGNKTGIEQEGYRIPDEGELVVFIII